MTSCMPWQATFIIAMLGALVGGILSLLVQRWRFSVDQWSARATELCTDIIALADASSEFWLAERKKDDSELAADHVRIRGGIERMSALRLPFQRWCSRQNAIELEGKWASLDDKISGGDFMKATRKADPDRALEIQYVASELVAHIHNSRIEGATISGSLKRVLLDRTSAR